MTRTITSRMIRNAKAAVKRGDTIRGFCIGMNINYWTMVKELERERRIKNG